MRGPLLGSERVGEGLLDLQSAYTRYDQDFAADAEFGFKPERTRDEIADEYADVLRQVLSTPDNGPVQ